MITVKASQMVANRLGRQGENERMRLEFDISAMQQELPGAIFVLFNLGPADSASYPCPTVTIDGGSLYWVITSAELRAEGRGKAELIATVDGVVAKSVIYNTIILEALDGSGEVPEPWETWQTEFAGMVADAQAAAAEAAESVEHYPRIEGGVWMVWDAATGAYVSTGVQATGPQGERGGTGDTGPQGKPGQPGTPGRDGVSPTATVTQTATGATLTVTDAGGTTTAEISNGQDGAPGAPGAPGSDGVSPTVTVTDIPNGHRITITDATGAHSFDVLNGEDGEGVPAGGTTGQVLVKASGADYATAWADKSPVEQVSGSTPTITALPGIRYVCGEVTTLDITLPASGIVDVVFESGTTPTVLTVTPPSGQTMKWANGFDPTALEADTTYIIRITEGILGIATKYGNASQGSDGDYFHAHFEVTETSDQKEFVVIPSGPVSEVLVTGTALFDSYDGIYLFIGDTPLLGPKNQISSVNHYFALYGKKIFANHWIGRGNCDRWSVNPKLLTDIAQSTADDSYSDGIGNIRIASRWRNKVFQAGTNFDLYWRE